MDLDLRFLIRGARYAQLLVTTGFAVSTSYRTGGDLCRRPSQYLLLLRVVGLQRCPVATV